jgi:murein DD-endopeptidase MepM/ murein hydrolase activator NlpD
LQKTKTEYANFVRSAYKSDADPLAQLLAAPDFQGFLNRAVAIEHLTFLANRLIGHIHQVDQVLHNQQDLVRAKKKEADKQRSDLVDQKAALVTQQAHQQDLENRLRQSIAQVKYELVAINGQSAALAQKIADMEIARQDQLIAEAEQAAWQQAQFWMQHNLFTLPNANANHSTKYPLVWPLQQGSITLVFGPCSQSFEPPGFGYPHFHTGVDIAYNQGTPILAADDGIVVAADSSVLNGQLVGYGNYIILAHRNNFFSLYGHMLGFQVKAGDSVHQGQLIGYEGSTGNSTGPHVHFEYRYGGQPTNPLPYLPPNGPNSFSQ